MYEKFLKRIADFKIVPVAALADPRKAGDLADALVKGGLPIAEITFRTAGTLDSIRTMASRGDMEVGAGTVRNLEQAKAAIDAGASFIVAPGFNLEVVKWAVNNGIPILPGVDSTLGIEMALNLGLNTVKFFPAEASGGLSKIKALHGPYPDVHFVPTGGISSANVAEWLSHPAIIACGGSWLVAKKLLESCSWGEISRLTGEAVTLI